MTAEGLERRIARGDEPVDEFLLEAVGWFDPPLLDPQALALVARELDPRRNRAGRPTRRGLNLGSISDALEHSPRLEALPLFRAALIDRLRSRRRFTSDMASRPFGLRMIKKRRDDFIRSLYSMFSESFSGDRLTARFEHLGSLLLGHPDLAPSERRMILVKDVMRERLAMDTPSIVRMFNIFSEGNSLHSV
ncbi:MAG: hypothetical protein JNJ92_04965 [Altererythrobacter sp.]|nr:hypothetical protein [Altererythrobacter sp.]